MVRGLAKIASFCLILSTLLMASACTKHEDITALSQLADKRIAVPTGTMADKLVLSRFPQAKIQYYNTVLDTVMAVKTGKADAAAYDEPILKNIAAKNEGVSVLPELITKDNYGFAVQMQNTALKKTIDGVVEEMKKDGRYSAMQGRWFPKAGAPGPMPTIELNGTSGVLTLGTAAVTEPFSFVDGSQNIIGFDIEIARTVAQKLGKKLEIVNLEFGAVIPALVSGKVDMIGACITISEERAKKVLFSEPYYEGGIGALVREPKK